LRVEAQSLHSDLAKWTITAIADGSFVWFVCRFGSSVAGNDWYKTRYLAVIIAVATPEIFGRHHYRGGAHDIWLSSLPWRRPRYLAVIIAEEAPTIFGCHYCRGGAHDIWLSLLQWRALSSAGVAGVDQARHGSV
jgi:hypothetical protein